MDGDHQKIAEILADSDKTEDQFLCLNDRDEFRELLGSRRAYLMLAACRNRSKVEDGEIMEFRGGLQGPVDYLWIPSIHFYGLLIKCMSIIKHPESIRYLWNHMTLYSAQEPESVTYGCTLDALIQCDLNDEAVDLFNFMKENAPNVQPNAIMYSTLIKGFANAKQHRKALALYGEMRNARIPINTVTINSLVNACARSGAMKEANEVLESMWDAGITPDLVTFSTVLKGYCLLGEVQKAFWLLQELKTKGIQPDGILYNTLLDGCVRTKVMMNLFLHSFATRNSPFANEFGKKWFWIKLPHRISL